jgi:hypothetical protein
MLCRLGLNLPDWVGADTVAGKIWCRLSIPGLGDQ